MTKLFFLCLMTSLLPFFTVAAQSIHLTADELYEKARTIAFEEKDYQQARDIISQALEEHPDNHDFRIFLSRLYAWDNNFNKARSELMYILQQNPENREALLAVIDVESWSGNYDEALQWIQKALSWFPADKIFMMEQASAYENLGKRADAQKLYRQLLDMYPNDREIIKKLQKRELNVLKNKAAISFRHDQFTEELDPWTFLTFQLTRQTAIGPVMGGIQYANRFSADGIQFNLEAYPRIFKGLYSYVNSGYSDSSIYPEYRLGVSLFQTLPNAFEIEAGLRYMNFIQSQVYIYHTSLSKYIRNYFFTGRMYYVPSTEGDSYSFLFLGRRYFRGVNTYIGLSSGFGSASDNINFTEDLRRLSSWFIDAKTQFALSTYINLGGSFGFISEEFSNSNRQRFRGEISVSYNF